MLKTYKKTATIDAMPWDGSDESYTKIAEWAAQHGVLIRCWLDPSGHKLEIPTLEGPMYASIGDFIAKGVKNEFWAINPDIMAKTYKEV